MSAVKDAGRLWDMLWVLHYAIKTGPRAVASTRFQLYALIGGVSRPLTLRAVMGPRDGATTAWLRAARTACRGEHRTPDPGSDDFEESGPVNGRGWRCEAGDARQAIDSAAYTAPGAVTAGRYERPGATGCREPGAGSP